MLTDHDLWERRQEYLRDNEPDYALTCEWCDEIIDQADVSVEACEIMGGNCCATCYSEWGH